MFLVFLLMMPMLAHQQADQLMETEVGLGEGKGVRKGEALPHKDPSMREHLAPHGRRRHRWETEEGRRSLRSESMIPKLPWSWLLKRHGQEVRTTCVTVEYFSSGETQSRRQVRDTLGPLRQALQTGQPQLRCPSSMTGHTSRTHQHWPSPVRGQQLEVFLPVLWI